MGSVTPPPLADVRRSIEADRVEAALDLIRARFPNVRHAEPGDTRQRFNVVTGRIEAPGATLVNMRTSGLRLTWDPIDRFAFFFPVQGAITLGYGARGDTAVAGEHVSLARADRARSEMFAGYDGYFIIVDKIALRREAEAWCGESIVALSADETVHGGEARARVAEAMHAIVARAADDPATRGTKQAPAGSRGALFRALLEGPFRSTLGRYRMLGEADVGAASLRRAIDYLRARHADDVSMADLAAAAGVGVRALQATFRRRIGATPWSYLRMCRLEAARAQLSRPEPGLSVTRVAMDVGAYHLGEFSVAYRQRFGESPRATLARATGGLAHVRNSDSANFEFK